MNNNVIMNVGVIKLAARHVWHNIRAENLALMANCQEYLPKEISKKKSASLAPSNSLFVWVIPCGYKLKTAFTGRRV